MERCIYAEMLKNKKVTLTIEAVRESPKPLYCNGANSRAWDIMFAEKDAEGNVFYVQIPQPDEHGKRTTILRQFYAATGSDPGAESVGKKITMFPVPSKKSATGQAIRIVSETQN